jgi:hypothetical protein
MQLATYSPFSFSSFRLIRSLQSLFFLTPKRKITPNSNPGETDRNQKVTVCVKGFPQHHICFCVKVGDTATLVQAFLPCRKDGQIAGCAPPVKGVLNGYSVLVNCLRPGRRNRE